MRIAVLCDVHGNLPALDAVLTEVDLLDVDMIVFDGDAVPGPFMAETDGRVRGLREPGPFMAETVARVRRLGERSRFVMGNGYREVVEAFDAGLRVEAGTEGFERF